jgi:putative phosphoribosyl transferase
MRNADCSTTNRPIPAIDPVMQRPQRHPTSTFPGDRGPLADDRPDPPRSGAFRSHDGDSAGALASPLESPAPAPSTVRFRDRRDAGRQLAALLANHALLATDRDHRPVVLAIPRGGLPVAVEIARALGAPLDVAVVRKVGAPGNPEFAIGALAEGGVRILSDDTVHALGLSPQALHELLDRGERELLERLLRYRGARAPLPLRGRTSILVDDGLATGSSALAAVESLHRRGAAHVILAVPVAARQSARMLRERADEVVCVETPPNLWAVGYWYDDFRPTRDADVTALLGEYPEDDPRREDDAQPQTGRSGDPAAP